MNRPSPRTSARISLAAALAAFVVTALLATAALAVAATPLSPVVSAEVCTNPDCHAGGPDGTTPPAADDQTPTPAPVAVPLALSKPSVSARPRVRKTLTLAGTVSAPHDESSSVNLEISRKVRGRYRPWRTVSASLAPGASGYRTTVRLPSRGSWRVRATHADALHAASASNYRVFAVR